VFAGVWKALDLRAQAADETTARGRGCVIGASGRFRTVAAPYLLAGVAAPERSLVVELEDAAGRLTAASFHQVAGSDRRKWGPAKKRQTFEAIAAWASRQRDATVFGIDANSPRVDALDVAENVYFFARSPGDQAEQLLHDPSAAPHNLPGHAAGVPGGAPSRAGGDQARAAGRSAARPAGESAPCRDAGASGQGR
jgi:hypothetical protein